MSYYVQAQDAAGQHVGSQQHRDPYRQPAAAAHQPRARQADHRHRLTPSSSSPANANDNDLDHVLGGLGATRAQLTVGAGRQRTPSARWSVKLNPDPAWGTRTQTIQVLGRDQTGERLQSTLVSAGELHVQPGHRQRGDHPGQRQLRRRPAAHQLATPAPRAARSPSSRSSAPRRRTRTSTVTRRHVDPDLADRDRRDHPVRHGDEHRRPPPRPRPTSTSTSAARSRSAPPPSARSRPAAPRRSSPRTSARQTAGTYAVTAKVDEANTRDRAERRQQQRHRRVATSWSRRCRARTWCRYAGVDAEQPVRRQHGHLHRRASRTRATSPPAAAAHGITLTVLNDRAAPSSRR